MVLQVLLVWVSNFNGMLRPVTEKIGRNTSQTCLVDAQGG